MFWLLCFDYFVLFFYIPLLFSSTIAANRKIDSQILSLFCLGCRIFLL